MIKRRTRAEIVDFSSDEFKEDDDNYYCSHCLSFGFKVKLRNRVYPEGEQIPIDHENWKQCHECGLIVPIYELQKEASIKDVIETTDNPFDIGKSFLGIDSRTSAKKRKKQRDNQKELDNINDPDLKRELASGQTRLISYTES